MNDIGDGWREILEPPPGGLAQLIDAVESSRHRHFRPRPRFAFAGISAAAMLVAVFGFAFQAHRSSPEYRLRRALQDALRPAADGLGIEVENGAALRVPSSDPNVRIYWIAQLPITAYAMSRK
jgi:hypothetical protein